MVGGGNLVGGGAVGGGGGCVGCASCEVAAGPASMSYVGGGFGAYIQETTYKYVGLGAGEFDMVTPKKTNMMCIYLGSGLGLLALLAALLLLLPGGPTTTTTPMPQPP